MNHAPFALCAFVAAFTLVSTMSRDFVSIQPAARSPLARRRSLSFSMVALMVMSTMTAIGVTSMTAMAVNDADGDGLSYAQEYLLNTQPADPDTDGDGLPDGWEWKYGLDPLDASTSGDNGATGDPDGDGLTNAVEYNINIPMNWDSSSTPTVLDNGVWWNGTVPVRDWSEEHVSTLSTPACGTSGSDGSGSSVILCDEDPPGDICNDGLDNDGDGFLDQADSDNDGDANCGSDDDDGDGVADEDPDGWDTDGDGMPDGWEYYNNLDPTSSSNNDGANGDPDNDNLTNLQEYINPGWDTECGGNPCFVPGPDSGATETHSPCNPVTMTGPASDPNCETTTANVDSVTETNPNRADTDRDGVKDGDEVWTYLTDPTASDTDGDGISDGIEVGSGYGTPAQASDPRDNNSDGDQFDDGDEDLNGNGLLDAGETDPTRREDAGDEDNDGLENWEENMTCTLWNVADTDHGGVIDGLELQANHSTNPCDSIAPFSTTVVSYTSSTNRLEVTDPAGFNPNGGVGRYNASGTYTDFAYTALQGTTLRGVATAPPSGPGMIVEAWNGSFCHTEAVLQGLKSSTMFYCDDDYEDSDGDGLANWEEITGAYGYTSNQGLVDTDGDGQSDFDEVINGTDPRDPCYNSLDTDGDGLNDYFETSTNCPLDVIGISNGTVDLYQTDETKVDTDGGGIDDRTEYTDSTNPENVPSDDVHRSDFDGDGIPDEVENITGTDWRDPDTDGGGMSDGLECPQPFWFTGCSGSGFDPWDPSDDITQNEVVFYAQNTSGVVDPNVPHYWRQMTYDNYTGIAYGALESEHPFEDVVIPHNNASGMPDSNFWNDTVIWSIDYQSGITSGPVPVPSNLQNITFLQDTNVELERNNLWRIDVKENTGSLQMISAIQPEIFYSTATQDVTINISGFDHESSFDSELLNMSSPLSFPFNVTNGVISDTGATSAYGIAQAIADFLANGNASTTFVLDGNGSDSGMAPDLAHHILAINQNATCSEYATVFTTMMRLAGFPARKVSGFSGGIWNGSGYTVMSHHSTYWGEVRMQTNAANGNRDLGWIPFNPCPSPEDLEVVAETWTPTNFDRDGSTLINVSGTLRFTDNQTAAGGVLLSAYLVPANQTSLVPGPAANVEREIGTGLTAADGTFTIEGKPITPVHAGYQKVVYVPRTLGVIQSQLIEPDWFINVTDDVNITHLDPAPINAPRLGAGSTTSISGTMVYENPPNEELAELGTHTLWLNYTSTVDGDVTLSTTVGQGGAWEFSVALDANEPFANISATLEFGGWQSSTQSFTGSPDHLRANSLSMTFVVEAAPDISATIEGPLTNSSRLVVDDTVWVNGTAQTVATPATALSGDLEIAIRENGSGSLYEVIANLSVSGTYSTSFLFDKALLQSIPAGRIDLRARFYPSNLNSTDDADLSGSDHWLVSRMNITFEAASTARGNPAAYTMTVSDHRGQTPDNVTGTYTNSFNGGVVNTTTDPQTAQFTVMFTPGASLAGGDYTWETDFGGSDYFVSDSFTTSVRIQGEAEFNPSSPNLANDWTHIGDQNWLTADLFDSATSSVITGNNTTITVSLVHPEMGPIDVGSGQVNSTTGAINITLTAPLDLPSAVYELNFMFLWEPVNGTHDNEPYYIFTDDFPSSSMTPPPPTSTSWGIQSEARLDFNTSSYLTEMNTSVDLEVLVLDIANNSAIADASVDFIIDWGNTNETLGTATTNSTGHAVLTYSPSGEVPGKYTIRAIMADDVTDTLSTPNAGRWLGNNTTSELTIQVGTSVEAQFPTQITAGLRFNLNGIVLDADNSSRPISSAVQLDVFWLDNPAEVLVNDASTAANGSFNLSVPTDTAGNGTERGNHILVIQVVNESNPFYLFGAAQSSILVMGQTVIEDAMPSSSAVVERGSDIDLAATLKESSNMYNPLDSQNIAILFDDTWLTEQTTDGIGSIALTHSVPNTQPLGLITITFMFNQTVDLLSTNNSLNTITISTSTTMTLDVISANPVAGESFNISGDVVSDNGSGIINRDGSVLTHTIQFRIDGETTDFSVSGGLIAADGSWNATIILHDAFARGDHNLTAVFVPTVNYYLGSEDSENFTSKGFTTLRVVKPTMSGGEPSLLSATLRNGTLEVQLSLIENTNDPVSGATIDLQLMGTTVTSSGVTDSGGVAWANFTIPNDLTPGEHVINVAYAGLNQSDGLIGSSANATFVVLANTTMYLDNFTTSLVVEDYLVVQGRLLDDLGLPLQKDGQNYSGVVYLLIDGNTITSTQTNNSTGEFSFAWQVPISFAAGNHSIEVSFTGDPAWSNPGSPDANIANPPYYMPSVANGTFGTIVPTVINLASNGTTVDRGDTIWLNGTLQDIVDIGLGNRPLTVYLNSNFYTTAQTEIDGGFTIPVIIPKETPLGPADISVAFGGEEFYLNSSANGTWVLFSPITITVSTNESAAINENMTITGTVLDNNLDPVRNHSLLLQIDGMVIANDVRTTEDGTFSITWLVQALAIGEHNLTANANEQGYYREGQGNTTFFVAHRTAISLSFSSSAENHRGQAWIIEGRLYDNDSISRQGVSDALLAISLDGVKLEDVQADSDGYFTATIPIASSSERGYHDISVAYMGNETYMESAANLTSTTMAKVVIDVIQTSSQVIRGDSSNQVNFEGRLIEVGGNQSVISNEPLVISTICGSAGLDACEIIWGTDGSFFMSGTVGFEHEPGTIYLMISFLGNQSQFLLPVDVNRSVELMVDLEFDIDFKSLVPGEQDSVEGTVIASDKQARQQGREIRVEGIPITAILTSEGTNNSAYSVKVQETDSSGTAYFEFKADPAYSDSDYWGLVFIELDIEDSRISGDSLTNLLQNWDSQGQIEVEEAAPEEETPTWMYVAGGILIAAAVGGYMFWKRREDAIKEFSDIFSYTAELLAAGDEMREAIYLCYENLCRVLMKHGYLRRDFETVREFEMAIRKALPINETSLMALDQVFEEARYSAHEMTEAHKQFAQESLHGVIRDIDNMDKVAVPA